jgi:hypothetical protein
MRIFVYLVFIFRIANTFVASYAMNDSEIFFVMLQKGTTNVTKRILMLQKEYITGTLPSHKLPIFFMKPKSDSRRVSGGQDARVYASTAQFMFIERACWKSALYWKSVMHATQCWQDLHYTREKKFLFRNKLRFYGYSIAIGSVLSIVIQKIWKKGLRGRSKYCLLSIQVSYM